MAATPAHAALLLLPSLPPPHNNSALACSRGLSRVLAPHWRISKSVVAVAPRWPSSAPASSSLRPVVRCEAQGSFESVLDASESPPTYATLAAAYGAGVSTTERPSVESASSGIVMTRDGAGLELNNTRLPSVEDQQRSGGGGAPAERTCLLAVLLPASDAPRQPSTTQTASESLSPKAHENGVAGFGGGRADLSTPNGEVRADGIAPPSADTRVLKETNGAASNPRLVSVPGALPVHRGEQSATGGQNLTKEATTAEAVYMEKNPYQVPFNGSAAKARESATTTTTTKEVGIAGIAETSASAANGVVQEKKAATSSKGGMRWSMLLSTEALEDAHLFRASSVTDAHVLRRKGRLKEQDGLIEFIISMHATHSPFQVMEKVERWVREHAEDPMRSTLNRLIPALGRFHTPLPLVRALREYDEFASLSRRRYVPPNFAEVRHVINIAQVHAIAEKLSLITFDADGTIYADGHHIQGDNKMIGHIIKLMQQGVHVAIVTAAGYPGNAAKFEDRLAGLLEAFEDLQLAPATTQLFHVMGGECNYLLRVNDKYRLEFVADELWKSADMLQWAEPDVQKLLDDAEASLRSAAARLRVPIDIVRKPRAVGALPKDPTIYEVLEEMALTVQVQLRESGLPFCAFNGGNDVFVDVGNKSVGLRALMKFLNKKPRETLHVGDRFTVSGNDMATRSQCSVLWVANPEETAFFARLLLRDIRLARLDPYRE